MMQYAAKQRSLLSAFTGEHVGEPRLLICLYDDPLLHVDIKFLILEEFEDRIENPAILFDTDNKLRSALENTNAKFPYPDYQWIEDRFWIWIHYTLTKVGRGEYIEAIDSISFLRQVVLGPLLHLKNGNLPRGVRKAESLLAKTDFENLKKTIAYHSKESILESLRGAVVLYRHLRDELFKNTFVYAETEQKVMEYFTKIGNA